MVGPAEVGLVSRMLVGGEGGEGGRRRQRQRAGLRTDAPCRRRVSGRLRDTDCVAAVVGGICYPGNKELLWGAVRLHPPFPLERSQSRPPHRRADCWSEPPGGTRGRVGRDAAVLRLQPH